MTTKKLIAHTVRGTVDFIVMAENANQAVSHVSSAINDIQAQGKRLESGYVYADVCDLKIVTVGKLKRQS